MTVKPLTYLHFDTTEKRTTAYNSTYPKVAVQWLNQAFCFYQSLCLVDSEVLGNRHLRVAANRYAQPYCDTTSSIHFTFDRIQ
jgi:hypothetical protein